MASRIGTNESILWCFDYRFDIYFSIVSGIRLFDDDIKSTDVTESKALIHGIENIDIYSNSWGPGDMAWQVEGPGQLTTKALEIGIKKVWSYWQMPGCARLGDLSSPLGS